MLSTRIQAAAVLITAAIFPCHLFAQQAIIGSDVVFQEKDGLLAVEAEHFQKQTQTDVRAFYVTHADSVPNIKPDGDPPHLANAGGNAYVEILPDTRRTHADKLERGINFQPEPGKMAVLHYPVHIQTPGTYYVWVRAHSTGSEDNGLHVGLDGEWPESGQRLQWCEGKKTWRWESKQRTEAQHCGEPGLIFLEIDEPGLHTIHFSMREDGFEFDRWLITIDREFSRPESIGPPTALRTGTLPKPFRQVKANAVTATSRAIIPEKSGPAKTLSMPARMFNEGDVQGYYLEKGKSLAINPDRNKSASAARTFPYPTGVYNVTLHAVGENDGSSSYSVQIDKEAIGDFACPLSTEQFADGPQYNKTWKKVPVTEGAVILVTSKVGSKDGQEFSRGRWNRITFTPADDATRKLAAPILARQGRQKPQSVSKGSPDSSPTKNSSAEPLQQPRKPHGDGSVKITGETKQWHKITLTLNGPFAHEKDNAPNPFIDYDLRVNFEHADGTTYLVPGYFAADGNAANSSAESGTTWRAHFAPDKTGEWTYTVHFRTGKGAALSTSPEGKKLSPFDGVTGKITVSASDKTGRDLRAAGRLQYVGKRYLQHAGSGKYFLKAGADAPETLLAFKDFDNTLAGNPKKAPLKSWSPHVQDWTSNDPSWGDGKGKGLIGAINYLSSKGCNVFSFLTYNAGGDGDNVWPFIQREDKLHYDCSKLDQWAIVFDHGTAKGMYLHFKMQETENDDHKKGKGGGTVPECLDGGNLGQQRKLYCRELIARFGHNLALNWNLGEENTQTTQQQKDMINYINAMDPYDHLIVVHTFPDQQDRVYKPLLGDASKLTGASLQNSSLQTTHQQTVKWVEASERAGKPWVVAFDESGSAAHAQSPDLGYKGFDGTDNTGKKTHNQHDVRKQTLWGTLMAGGAGNEYYFGYRYAENDIVCEDWRSRDQSWDYCRIALNFFHDENIPFWEMKNMDELIDNPTHGPEKFCLAKPGSIYLVYLPSGGTTELDLSGDDEIPFQVQWLNPQTGGALVTGNVSSINGGRKLKITAPESDSADDWLAVIRRQE